jgi:hypothetical protein
MFEFQKKESEKIQAYQEWLESLTNQDLYHEQIRLENSVDIMEGEMAEVCEMECLFRFKALVELEINGPVF